MPIILLMVSPYIPRMVFVCALALAVTLGAGVARASAAAPVVTISQYEHSTLPDTFDAQGCSAGAARKVGLVILDFGRPAYRNGAYGTIDFSGNFQWNVPISAAMKAYIYGYIRCRPAGTKGILSVARGTNDSCSNEDPQCCPNGCGSEPPSFTTAGYAWAVRTNQVQNWIVSKGWKNRVRATAAIDAEPAWDPAWTATNKFVAAFDVTANHSGWKLPPSMWDFGSMEPGYWTPAQAWNIAAGKSGVNHSIPEIYYPGMAREWADLSYWAVVNHGQKITFGGATSQWASGAAQCGYAPAKSANQLLIALAIRSSTKQGSLARRTDFPCAAPVGTPAQTALALTGEMPNVYGHDGVPCRSIKVC